MKNYPFSLTVGDFIFHKKNTPYVKNEIRDNLKASLASQFNAIYLFKCEKTVIYY